MKPLLFMAGLDVETLEPIEVITAALASLERFFDDVLPVLHAAQADPELRSTLAAFVEANDLGPHKGVKLLGGYLRAQQTAGRVRADADADAIALLVIDCAFAKAARKQMMLHSEQHLPSERRPAQRDQPTAELRPAGPNASSAALSVADGRIASATRSRSGW